MSVETVLIFGVVLIILLIALAVATYIMNRPGAAQALAAVAASPPTEIASSPTPSPTVASPTPAPSSGSEEARAVTLTLEATEHVLVRVTCGARVVFDGLMAPGQAETWSDDELIVVATGNGAGLQIAANGQPSEPMCGRGEVCTRAWEPTGEVSPQ
jgi:hypothetical protein